MNLRFQYEVVNGDGWFGVAPEFADDDGDMGGRVLYYPRGDGPRTDQIRVTAIDNEGHTSVSIVEVEMPNTVPSIVRVDFQAIPALHIPANDPAHPIIIEPKRHGGYRVRPSCSPTGWHRDCGHYLVDEPANEVVEMTADFTDDERPDEADFDSTANGNNPPGYNLADEGPKGRFTMCIVRNSFQGPTSRCCAP